MNISMTGHVLCRTIGAIVVLLAIQANAQRSGDDVDGYTYFGRGSCQDTRGKMYSYLQRVMTFPDAETCGRQECARFSNLQAYRGFEFSVTKRCACLFDVDQVPVVPNSAEDPKYVSKSDSGSGEVGGRSGTPGAWCYQFGSSTMASSTGFFITTLLASVTMYMLI